ncbi:hypothetical protein D6851_12500 [Altericroceibacterium spongiae]|uniref:DUF2550 family protein n=1 Tax=Altericroceibacterium spongiae TaxID=2320269 RepID=A0A420EF03_9SPHN|nr:hypothetical protein [Altericroceibacterium spongiae]RKF19277.1 hypothetical protein D6851_12500 [Altericroceibacterium spongiae]
MPLSTLFLLIGAALLVFLLFWLLVTTVLQRVAGWPQLEKAFPDRDERPEVIFRMQSGMIGMSAKRRIALSACLRYDICPGGMRFMIWRLFGPFAKPFFVPWRALEMRDDDKVLRNGAFLAFGKSESGGMWMSGPAAVRLRDRAKGRIKYNNAAD